MLKTIADMGIALNLKLVAEGIEDQGTAELLRDMGVHYLQGYYFAKPLPMMECKHFIDKPGQQAPIRISGQSLKKRA